LFACAPVHAGDCHNIQGLATMRFQEDRVAAALLQSWSGSSSGQWFVGNPARGQCNVTALLVNEYFGGEILKTQLLEGDHFYNRIEGKRVDLTDSQFAAPIAYLDLASDRAEALAGTSTAQYDALKTRSCGTTRWSQPTGT
jgi:hypothetical protein